MKIFIGIIVTVLALWSGAWFTAAWWADGKISEMLESQREHGLDIDCADRAVRGFPLSMGVGCDSLVIRQPDGSQIDAGAVTTDASLTAPGEVIAKIDGPLTLQAGDVAVQAEWKNLEAFIDVSFDGGFDLTSFFFDRLKAQSGEVSATAASGAGLLRPETAERVDNLEATITLNSVTANLPAGVVLSEFSIELDARLDEGYRDLIIRRLPASQIFADGASGEIRHLKLQLPDGGKLVVGGPLEFDANGLLSGLVTVGIAKPEAVRAWARSISPVLEQPASLLAQSVAGMGKSSILGGEGVKAIELTIDRGEVRLGFIKLFDIPAVK